VSARRPENGEAPTDDRRAEQRTRGEGVDTSRNAERVPIASERTPDGTDTRRIQQGEDEVREDARRHSPPCAVTVLSGEPFAGTADDDGEPEEWFDPGFIRGGRNGARRRIFQERSRRNGSRETALALPANVNAFAKRAYLAHLEVSANLLTRAAYWSDFKRWLAFVVERGVDPSNPARTAVVAFTEWMRRDGDSSMTRVRRLSALSSLYAKLCCPGDDGEPPAAARNPFAVEGGVAREPAIPLRPTPIADVELVRGLLRTCGSDDLGVRDAAILRILWQTGMRRVSLLSMAFERLQRERDGSIIAHVVGKRGKQQRALVRGKAADALTAWLAILDAAQISSGPIWLGKCGAMTDRDVNHMFERRLKLIGAPKGALSPHMLRVSFLTRCPAPIDARRDAAAHSDPRTTAGYDRKSWRGREAFLVLPELEDFDDDEDEP
jgi:integrase/recombinase XerD